MNHGKQAAADNTPCLLNQNGTKSSQITYHSSMHYLNLGGNFALLNAVQRYQNYRNMNINIQEQE